MKDDLSCDRTDQQGVFAFAMTLEAYSPEKLDRLALRVLDVACALRQMAADSRDNGIEDMPLNDKKALEWLSKLEDWAHDGSARLGAAVSKRRAVQRGSPLASQEMP